MEVYASKPLLHRNTKLVATLWGACLQCNARWAPHKNLCLPRSCNRGTTAFAFLSLFQSNEHTCLA